MDMQTLELTADEVLVLTDRTLNTDYGTEEQRVSPLPLLLRLGSAYVEQLGGGAKATEKVALTFSCSELWLLRSKVTSGDKTATDNLFGVKLLTKIYAALMAEDAISQGLNMPLADASGESFGEWEKAAFQVWSEKHGTSNNP
jgi:hypothetical protein